MGQQANIDPFQVTPSQLPDVDKGQGYKAEHRNAIINQVQNASKVNLVFGNETEPIRFFKITEVKDNGFCSGNVMRRRSGDTDEVKLNLIDTGIEFSNLYDLPDIAKKGQVAQWRYDSRNNMWFQLGTTGDGSDSACLLEPNCNFWGIVTESEDGKPTEVNAYLHQGAFMGTITEILNWTECDIDVGDLVSIKTDDECVARITPDPCVMAKRICCESSSSSSSSESDSSSSSSSSESDSSSGSSSSESDSSLSNEESFSGCCDTADIKVHQNPYPIIRNWDDPTAASPDVGKRLYKISWTLDKAGGVWSDGEVGNATMTLENLSDRTCTFPRFNFATGSGSSGEFIFIGGTPNKNGVSIPSGGSETIDLSVRYKNIGDEICCVSPWRFFVQLDGSNFPIGTKPWGNNGTNPMEESGEFFGAWADNTCEPDCVNLVENFAPFVNSPQTICEGEYMQASMDYPPWTGGAIGERPVIIWESFDGTTEGVCTSASSGVGTICSPGGGSGGIYLMDIQEGQTSVVTINVEVTECLGSGSVDGSFYIRTSWDRDWFFDNRYT